ncbi:hypothetical protein CF319_g1337 [Tilletia indica]|nr:hypothetical protein CF319_g1337 [Tilletia indica]
MIRRPPTQIMLSMRDVEEMRVARARAQDEAAAQTQQHQAQQPQAAGDVLPPRTQYAGADDHSQQESVVGETQHAYGSSQFQSQDTSVGPSTHTQGWYGGGGGAAAGQQTETRRDALERERRELPPDQRITGNQS